jgi:hypothetical protein
MTTNTRAKTCQATCPRLGLCQDLPSCTQPAPLHIAQHHNEARNTAHKPAGFFTRLKRAVQLLTR